MDKWVRTGVTVAARHLVNRDVVLPGGSRLVFIALDPAEGPNTPQWAALGNCSRPVFHGEHPDAAVFSRRDLGNESRRPAARSWIPAGAPAGCLCCRPYFARNLDQRMV